MGFAIAQFLLAELRASGAPPEPISRGTRDMKRAYRQLACAPAHQRFQVVCLWHPTRRTWVFAELRGLAFGLAVSVLHFNRVPAHICAIARRWLAIPAINFYDDCKLTALARAAPSCWRWFKALVELLGWLFDPDKDSPMGPEGPFLGLQEDFSRVVPDGVVTVRTKEAFAARLGSSLSEA